MVELVNKYACSLSVRSREERREVGRGLGAVRTEDWWDIKQGWDVTDLDVSAQVEKTHR